MSRVTGWLLALLTLTGAYLYAAPAPTLVYGVGVIAHVVAGVAALVLLLRFARELAGPGLAPRVGWGLTVAGGVAGIVIIAIGATLPHRSWFWAHVALSTLGAAVYHGVAPPRGPPPGARPLRGRVRGLRGRRLRRVARARDLVEAGLPDREPGMPPASMDQEGQGRSGPFFPSSIRTPDGKHIKSSFFMDSKRASGATRTSTSSGTARRTTSRRSTTSGTARPSSTCRTSTA